MIVDWLCCLCPPERAILLYLLQMFGSGQLYIEVAQYDLLWQSVGTYAALKRASNMRGWMNLTEGVVIIGENPVPVYFFDIFYMGQILLVALSPAGQCPDGCFITEFMRAH